MALVRGSGHSDSYHSSVIPTLVAENSDLGTIDFSVRRVLHRDPNLATEEGKRAVALGKIDLVHLRIFSILNSQQILEVSFQSHPNKLKINLAIILKLVLVIIGQIKTKNPYFFSEVNRS